MFARPLEHSSAGGMLNEDAPRSSISPGWRLLLSLALSCCAVAIHSPLLLGMLGAANVAYLLLCRVKPRLLWRASRFLIWQTAVLLVLHYARFGQQGVVPALRISSQLFLAFLPGMIFLEGTSKSQMAQVLGRVLPSTWAFVMGVSLHFLPLLVREMKTLYEAQVLRGARILPRDLFKPWCWPDFIYCLLVPSVVQGMALAGEIALAARVRDFGMCKQRTSWPASAAQVGAEKRK